MVESIIDFDIFMTSDGTETLILAFTSKTGKYVENCRHRFFLFGFFCQSDDIFKHFICLIQDSRLQGF